MIEVMVRKDLLQVADRNTGPLATIPNTAAGYDYERLTDYLKRVKQKYPEKTDATILLEADTPYDILVQVMDRVRVFEAKQGLDDRAGRAVPGYLDRRRAGGDAGRGAHRRMSSAPTGEKRS